MQTNKKLFFKQVTLLLIIYALCSYLGIYYGLLIDSIFQNMLEIFIFMIVLIISFILIPLMYLYFDRIRREKNLRILNNTFRSIVWFIIFVVVGLFTLSTLDIFYHNSPDLGFLPNLKNSFLYFFSSAYITDTYAGLLPDVIDIIKNLPYLFVAVLFYLMLRINKLFEEQQV